ncbi:MAG TPA: rhomboid family intramembrane serine protease [Anaeromyxobacteraceae bacterium]|nr:rhomboid family intramembrane serine protease [Anaeromyxobacteraceae bacterium]
MIPLKDENPSERPPIVTIALVATNVVAFLWQLSTGLELSVLRGGVIPYEVLTFTDVEVPAVVPPPLTIVTSMFLHGGLAHIGSNMLFLWIFGNNVEDALGRGRFLAFYVASGVVAALAQVAVSAMGEELGVPMVGASGAIAGVLAGYMVLFPHARVLTLLIIVIFIRLTWLPAGLLIGLWFALQLFSAVFGGTPGVAFFAHVGGFVAGFVLVRVMGRRARWRARRVSW